MYSEKFVEMTCIQIGTEEEKKNELSHAMLCSQCVGVLLSRYSGAEHDF